MRVLGKDGYIPGVALFFELTDEQLDRVSKDKDFIFKPELLKECMESKGDNCHLFGLYSDENNRTIEIWKHLKQLLVDYKTVSWWDRDMKEFKITKK